MFGIRNKDWDCFLEYRSFTDNLIASKFLYCNKNYQKDFDENFKKKFLDTYKFSDYDINQFILLLWKGVDPYQYMGDWGGITLIYMFKAIHCC